MEEFESINESFIISVQLKLAAQVTHRWEYRGYIVGTLHKSMYNTFLSICIFKTCCDTETKVKYRYSAI